MLLLGAAHLRSPASLLTLPIQIPLCRCAAARLVFGLLVPLSLISCNNGSADAPIGP